MKIIIDGFQKIGQHTADEEAFRDAIAEALACVVKKQKLAAFPSEAKITFVPTNGRGFSDHQQSTKLGTEHQRNENIDLSNLLSIPRNNAGVLRLTGSTMEALTTALKRFENRELIYQIWGIQSIDPYPRLSLNFSGPPGTGKTLAAHYIAKQMNKSIIEVSYADIVSKYFGQAAKNLVELYNFAIRSNAILFIDEAETLLSKRTDTNSDGVDHAVNSMRSQLLILMERTPILSIFASNMIQSYDIAFISRLLTVKFHLPDIAIRQEIWSSHLPKSLPIDTEVTPKTLAMRYDNLNGREISRAVVEAAHRVAIEGRHLLTLSDFDWAVNFVKEGK